MKPIYVVVLMFLLSCSGTQKYRRLFERANTIGEFEAGLNKKHVQLDSVQYFHNYPLMVNGRKYYCDKRYALIVSIYKSEAFRINDSDRIQSMDTCHIATMYLQEKGKDVRVFEKLDE